MGLSTTDATVGGVGAGSSSLASQTARESAIEFDAEKQE